MYFYRSYFIIVIFLIMSLQFCQGREEDHISSQDSTSTLSRFNPDMSKTPSYSLSAPLLMSTQNSASPASKFINPKSSEQYILIIGKDEVDFKKFKKEFQRHLHTFKEFGLIFTSIGEEGIKLHQKYQPCMSFIDYNLAGKMNGKEVVESLKKTYPYPHNKNLGYLVAFSDDVNNNKNMNADFQILKLKDLDLFKQALQSGLHVLSLRLQERAQVEKAKKTQNEENQSTKLLLTSMRNSDSSFVAKKSTSMPTISLPPIMETDEEDEDGDEEGTKTTLYIIPSSNRSID